MCAGDRSEEGWSSQRRRVSLAEVRGEAGQGQPLPAQLLQVQPPGLPGQEDCGAQPRQRPCVQHVQQGANAAYSLGKHAHDALILFPLRLMVQRTSLQGIHSHPKPGGASGFGSSSRGGRLAGRGRGVFPAAASLLRVCISQHLYSLLDDVCPADSSARLFSTFQLSNWHHDLHGSGASDAGSEAAAGRRRRRVRLQWQRPQHAAAHTRRPADAAPK